MDLAVLSGLQGAGKTTFARTHLAPAHAIVSRDFVPGARRSLPRFLDALVAAAAAGASVAADATHPTSADRARLVALAHALGLRPVLYFFPADLPASLARNAGRPGWALVPPHAIHATAQRLDPPAGTEGFAAVFTVRALEGGGFLVEEWRGLATP